MAGVGSTVELECTAVAAGGDGIARLADGVVVFVAGALPGERVRARLTQRRKDFARAETVAVLSPSADRVAPPCPRVDEGCGGCSWQHVAPAAQPRLKRQVVVDALRRIGRVAGADAIVRAGPALPAAGSRTTVRAAIAPDGRAGFRAASSHRVVPCGACMVAHPRLAALLADARFAGASEVTLRTGASSTEVLVVASPHDRGVVLPAGDRETIGDVVVIGANEVVIGANEVVIGANEVVIGADEVVIGADEVRAGAPASHEEVAGRRFRVSVGAFFQARPDGAAALVDAVTAALDGAVDPVRARLVDLYGGVGLFAATVGDPYAEVRCVESNAAAAADARHNLAHRGSAAAVDVADVGRWSAPPTSAARPTVVVADPARAGLGRGGVAAVVACDPLRLALVSCDAASFARDAALLASAGFALRDAVLVDLFPHTPHVEVVSRFDRMAPDRPAGAG